MCVKRMSLLIAIVPLIGVVQSATPVINRANIAALISGSSDAATEVSAAATIEFEEPITIASGQYLALLADGEMIFNCVGTTGRRLFTVESGGTLILTGITLQKVRAR